MGHEAHNGEDDKSCKHAGARIDAADNDGVPAEREGHSQGECDWQEGELVGSGQQGAGWRRVPGREVTGPPFNLRGRGGPGSSGHISSERGGVNS